MQDSELDALVRRLKAGDASLTKVQLNGCYLGPAGVARVLNELKPNSNVVELQLQANYIGTEGMTALLNVIEDQRQLRAIDLRFNLLPAAEIRRLWRKLQQNFTLEDVRIDEELGDEDEVPFQIVVGPEASETDGLTWSTFGKPQLVEFRTKLQELLISNRRIAECISGKGPELKLRNRSLEKVPELILLPHLKVLDLRGNCLNNLPLAGMDRMVSLEELLLDHNKIKSLPRSLCNLGKLRLLSARKNQITELPKCISCMASLKELRLSGNELFEMPIVIAAITTLQRVELEENPFIKRYPKFPTQSDSILPFLKEELKSRGLPKNPRMRVVVLGADMVGKSTLVRNLQPVESNDKKRKKRSSSSATSGASAPSFFSSKMGDLMSPSVSGVIGSGSGVLVNGNQGDIAKAPMLSRDRSDTLTGFASTMNVLGNTTMATNLSLLSGATTSSSDDGAPSSPHPFFLSSHAGASGVFINRPHIEISPVLLPSVVLPSTHPHCGTAEDLILNVWEFSGANTSLSAHSLFLSDLQTCFIIVFNLTQPTEFQSYIEHWLQTIQTRVKDASVLLVGTHADDKRCTKDYIEATFRAILQRTNAETVYPCLKFLYDVDTTNSNSLKGLRRTLFEMAMPDTTVSTSAGSNSDAKDAKALSVKVAESWLALEERLYAAREQTGGNQSKKTEFFDKLIRRVTGSKPPLSDIPSMASLQGASQAVLKTLKEAVSMDVSEQDLPTLVGYLNAVGAVMTLKDTGHVVLDPQWLMEAATLLFTPKSTNSQNGGRKDSAPSSAVLNGLKNDHITGKLGFVSTSEIESTIWVAPKYPSSEHGWLLGLFEKHDLIIPVDKKTYFLPYLLPAQPPAIISSIWAGDGDITEQRRYYVFNICPTTTFFKLLQKLLTLAEWETQVHWRFGLVMEDLRKTAQVFIFLDLESKAVKLIVRGRQQVLKMVAIAEAIEQIMNESTSSKKQKYTAMVPCRHCIQEDRELDASLFPLTTLEAAVNKNPANALVNCTAGKKPRTVRVDWLAPDVALSTFSGDRIEFKDIELGETIGEGGYATVYKGKWRGHVVAVKQVKLASVNIVNNETDNVFAEFRREVQLMSGLQNENLVVLKAICMEPFCMVIEFMELGSLYEYTHSPAIQSMDWSTRVNLALDIARGMAFLHGMMPPIVHRDLKSPNILLTQDAETGRLRAKVADFGLSRSLDFSRELDGASLEGNNPVWLAPEILLQQNYNEKVDVYSFGLILFEMISGQDYFGDVAFMSDIENLVIAGKRPKIDFLDVDPFGVQTEYVELLEACWDPSPAERPTFAEAVSALTSLLRKCGVEVADAPAAVVDDENNSKSDGGSSSIPSSSGEALCNTNESSDSMSTDTNPKRDILKEYKSQQREAEEVRSAGVSSTEDDELTPSPSTRRSNTSRRTQSVSTNGETSSPPSVSPVPSRRTGTLRKEKTTRESTTTGKRSKHSSSPRENTSSIDSSSSPVDSGLVRSGTANLSTSSTKSGNSVKDKEKRAKPKRKSNKSSTQASVSSSAEEPDSSEDLPPSASPVQSATLGRASASKLKPILPPLAGLSPSVRAQLSPRTGTEPELVSPSQKSPSTKTKSKQK